MTQLTDAQKQTVTGWVRQGDSLAEVQRKLARDLGVTLTYMEVRLLVADLGVAVKDKPSVRAAAPLKAQAPTSATEIAGDLDEPGALEETEETAPPGASTVTVDVDRITKPGSVVSGSVVFSDGVKATWMLDMRGRLGLSAATPGYRPSARDLQAFQSELEHQLSRRGY